MNNIIEDLNKRDIKDLIELKPFMEFDESLDNFDEVSISVPMNIGVGEAFNLNVDDIIISSLLNELNQHISHKISKELFKSVNYDYINVIGIDDIKKSRILGEYINSNDYKFCLSNVSIGAIVADSYLWNWDASRSTLSSGTIYKTGSIGKTDLLVDPYLKWDYTKMVLFNGVKINIQNLKFTIDETNIGIGSYVKLNLDFSISTDFNSKVIYIIENENSEVSLEYKSIIRDIKIDEIINGN